MLHAKALFFLGMFDIIIFIHSHTHQAMDTQRKTLLHLHKKESVTSVSSLRDARESVVSERINVHMMKLAEQRKQAGIISTPSSELLEAERRLAEVHVQHTSLSVQTMQPFPI